MTTSMETRRWESNPSETALQAAADPVSLGAMIAAVGVEPTIGGFRNRCLTVWPRSICE